MFPPPGSRSNIELTLSLNLVGIVSNMGPSPERLTGCLDEADNWAASVRQHCGNGANVGDDMERSEKVVRHILRAEYASETASLVVRGLRGADMTAGTPPPHQEAGALEVFMYSAKLKSNNYTERVCPRSGFRLYQLALKIQRGQTRAGSGRWWAIQPLGTSSAESQTPEGPCCCGRALAAELRCLVCLGNGQ